MVNMAEDRAIIAIVTCRELLDDGCEVDLVSHGVNVETGANVVLPCEEFHLFDCKRLHPDYGWILN